MARPDSVVDDVEMGDSPAHSFTSTSSDAMDIDDTPPSSADRTHNITLSVFPLFPRLPTAIRKRIWFLAAPSPRTRFVELHGYTSLDYTPKIRYIPPLPALFHVSQESRAVSIEHEGGEIIHFVGGNPSNFLFATNNNNHPDTQDLFSFYFNFSLDILFLSTRFTPARTSTETFRLRELSSVLPFPFIIQTKRILVTYSGADEYERIGSVLRPYAGLEVLYIGMMDWWSNSTVKRLLRKGWPRTGSVAQKISKVVVETEAEETDDDEESVEQLDRRIKVRERRRIVEVEVRLDE